MCVTLITIHNELTSLGLHTNDSQGYVCEICVFVLCFFFFLISLFISSIVLVMAFAPSLYCTTERGKKETSEFTSSTLLPSTP